MKIIITDADSRKAYDIINILQNVYDHQLVLFSSSGYRVQLPLVYGQQVHRLRVGSQDLFEEDFERALHQNEDETYCYMAVSEKATLHFYEYINNECKYSDAIHFLLPEPDKFNLARNKKQFQKYCEEHHFPVPKSYNQKTLSDLSEYFRPVLAKKNVGTGSVGMIYVEEKDQLHKLKGIDHDYYLIQEKINSDKNIHGGFFLCKDGETVSYHGHKRIRTFPEKGGVTVFSGTDDTDEIRMIGEKLLRDLNWSGFAMIEFMYDIESEEWKIIELNPRLWGSVMLSEYCDALLLENYVRLCQNKFPVKKAFSGNRFIRWLLPFEFLNLLKRKISIREFLNLDKKEICYINFTYGKWYSNILFQLFFTLNIRSIKRYFKKVFS